MKTEKIKDHIIEGTIKASWNKNPHIDCENGTYMEMDDISQQIESLMSDYKNMHVKINIEIFDITEDAPDNELTVNVTLRQINSSGNWESFTEWKGWDYYSGYKIRDTGRWDDIVKIPVKKAKEWGII